MKELFSSDKPVVSKEQDRFQRYNFSERIAKTIVNKPNMEGIVIGIYGAWGVGKTSVLNFIDEELNADDTILKLRFNPWRYNEEEALIRNFFYKIADLLGKELEKKKEKFGKLIAKYGSVTTFFGADISNIGNALGKVNLEELKNRVNVFLSESKNKLVIFIDDIDRLDKEEIYSLLKLVKLTADFSNTTYILFFDEQMVASAIGERFGKGDSVSGQNFLEKIIQVPLKIPLAQTEALKQYCLELVDKSLVNSNISWSKEEAERFISIFTKYILLRLNTPRLAIRYANSLSFSLPLLKGEVNLVDLMLIEAVKIFYPNYYEFIKFNPDYFLSSISGSLFHDSIFDSGTKDELSTHLKELGKDLTKKEINSAFELLKELFPQLNESFDSISRRDEDKMWSKNKRICSLSYFKRYFSYTVIYGEISDVLFDDLLNSIDKLEQNKLNDKISKFIDESSADKFINKIRNFEEEFEWSKSKKIAYSVAVLGDKFQNENPEITFVNLGFGIKSQAAIFIYNLMKNHDKVDDKYKLAKKLMLEPIPYSFSYELNNWLRTGKTQEEKMFSYDQYDEMAKMLTERAIRESGDKTFFETYPQFLDYIGHTWYKRDQIAFNSYVKKFLDRDKKNIGILLKAYLPTIHSSSNPKPFKGDLDKKLYDYINSFYEKEDIYKRIIDYKTLRHVNAGVVYWDNYGEKEFNEMNLFRQYIHWYNKEKENN